MAWETCHGYIKMIFSFIYYGVYVSQLIRYARACHAYDDLLKRGQLLTKMLMLQGYNESRLKWSFRKFYGRYNDLVCGYKLSLSHMLTNLFHWRDIICRNAHLVHKNWYRIWFIFIPFVRLSFSYWIWRRVIPFTLFRLRAHGGCDWSAEDAYSSMAPDPAFAFVEGPCCPTLDFVCVFLDYDYV